MKRHTFSFFLLISIFQSLLNQQKLIGNCGFHTKYIYLLQFNMLNGTVFILITGKHTLLNTEFDYNFQTLLKSNLSSRCNLQALNECVYILFHKFKTLVYSEFACGVCVCRCICRRLAKALWIYGVWNLNCFSKSWPQRCTGCGLETIDDYGCMCNVHVCVHVSKSSRKSWFPCWISCCTVILVNIC